MRLLRLFISKSDIEDAVISKHLSNQAALITFRMAFGIQSHTLRDAKKVANFAESKNISLNLIGKAGAASTRKKYQREFHVFYYSYFQ